MLKTICSFLAVVCVTLLLFMGAGCKKERLLTSGGELRFSADTLTFDTVFTAEGSFTAAVKIFNPQDQKIVISSVRLQNGAASFFRLNVDGFPGNEVKNLEVAANDSIYVFATVKIDPTSENSPFFIEDKLIATLNGNDFSIPVTAYGQNAHYVIGTPQVPYHFTRDTVFATDKPYVFRWGAWIDPGVTVTIPGKSRIYMHQYTRLVVDGTLKVMGTATDSVVFQGDRLDRAYFGYEGYPGEWGGIYINSRSKGSELHYTTLKNGGNSALGAVPAIIEVYVDSVGGSVPQLLMDGVTIQNSIGYGVAAYGGSIKAQNCLVHTCGAPAVALLLGGNYQLDNCTFVNYGSDKVAHVENPSLVLLNYYKASTDSPLLPGAMNATLRNCVVYGSLQNEVVIDSVDLAPCSVALQNCVLKVDPNTVRPWVVQSSVQYNADPMFEKTETEKWNFRVKSGSPLIDAGVDIPSITQDLAGKSRRNGPQDIGAYEFQ